MNGFCAPHKLAHDAGGAELVAPHEPVDHDLDFHMGISTDLVNARHADRGEAWRPKGCAAPSSV